MRIVIGLGNPGRAYQGTRHNIGFDVVDAVAERCRLRFRWSYLEYALAEGQTQLGQLVLLKPLTYMNRSGRALQAWSRRAGLAITGSPQGQGSVPVVVCDDLALPLGALRIRPRGSSGGQKGLESIIWALNGDHFPRVRLGVGPVADGLSAARWSAFVLDRFGPQELEVAARTVAYAAEAVLALLASDAEDAAARFNRRRYPQKD